MRTNQTAENAESGQAEYRIEFSIQRCPDDVMAATR